MIVKGNIKINMEEKIFVIRDRGDWKRGGFGKVYYIRFRGRFRFR